MEKQLKIETILFSAIVVISMLSRLQIQFMHMLLLAAICVFFVWSMILTIKTNFVKAETRVVKKAIFSVFDYWLKSMLLVFMAFYFCDYPGVVMIGASAVVGVFVLTIYNSIVKFYHFATPLIYLAIVASTIYIINLLSDYSLGF